jgi:hypothetical protein
MTGRSLPAGFHHLKRRVPGLIAESLQVRRLCHDIASGGSDRESGRKKISGGGNSPVGCWDDRMGASRTVHRGQWMPR